MQDELMVGHQYLCYDLSTSEAYLDWSQSMAPIFAFCAFSRHDVVFWRLYFYTDKIGHGWTVMLSSTGFAACMAITAGSLL